jgi:hypothetical protein
VDRRGVGNAHVSDARVEWLDVGGDVEPWRAVGLQVDADGRAGFLFTSLRIGVVPGSGIRGWAISGIDPAVDDIDGLPTSVVDPRSPTITDHPLGAIELDHVVILTDSLERTSSALEQATGSPLKRVRDVGEMRQGFHRVGSGGLIVEIVERPEAEPGRSVFWGVVINVADLRAAADLIGPDRLGPVKDAVQPGRQIATVRDEAGLGLPVALMTPSVR